MTQPQPSRLICLLSAAALLTTFGGCVSQAPEPSHPNSPSFGLRGVLPFVTVQPYPLQGNLPPSRGVVCQLSTARSCSEIFPEPARFCLLAAERCPREGTFQRVEPVPLAPDR